VLPDNDSQGSAGAIEAEVKWYNGRKGFGFVLGPDGQDVFFHASALTDAGIEPPETGDKLVCEIGSDRQGRRLVTKIFERKLGPGAPAGGGDRPPRRDFGNDRPPRRDFGDRGGFGGGFGGNDRGGFGDRPPRRDFGAPGGFGDRPPRRDFGAPGGFGDRPPRRDFGAPGGFGGGDRGGFGGGDRGGFGGGGFGGGDRGGFGAPRSFGDRPPRREFGGRDEGGPTEAVNGTVKWFDQVRGFGFVTPDDGGADVFLHSSVLQRAGKQEVQQGEKLQLEVRQGQRGRQAVILKGS
jgi:CspA family cold shock protein